MISLLVSHKANLEALDSEARTPFHRALGCSSHESRIAAVSALLRFRANPNAFVHLPHTFTTPALGWSPLHSAAVDCPDSQTIIRLLVEYGADLEKPLLDTNPPCTPLALVAEFLVWFHLEHAEATHRSLVWFHSKHPNATRQSLVREYDEHWKAVELLLELGADIEPALLAMNRRPNFHAQFTSLKTNIGNEHPVFLYRSVLPDRTKVHKHNRRYAPLIPEDRWEMASKCVKKGLERARGRVRRSKYIFQKITVLTCNHFYVKTALGAHLAIYFVARRDAYAGSCRGKRQASGAGFEKLVYAFAVSCVHIGEALMTAGETQNVATGE